MGCKKELLRITAEEDEGDSSIAAGGWAVQLQPLEKIAETQPEEFIYLCAVYVCGHRYAYLNIQR